MATFEDIVGEPEKYGNIPLRTKFYTAADIDFILKKKLDVCQSFQLQMRTISEQYYF